MRGKFAASVPIPQPIFITQEEPRGECAKFKIARNDDRDQPFRCSCKQFAHERFIACTFLIISEESVMAPSCTMQLDELGQIVNGMLLRTNRYPGSFAASHLATNLVAIFLINAL